MSYAMASIGELTEPPFSAQDIFDTVELGNATALRFMLDESQFDLTTADETNGETILHRAISLGRDEITEMLLQLANDHDPRMLNAQDRQGSTPLMHAAVKRNVALMKALIDMQSRTNGDVNSELAKRDVVVQALMSIEAQRDISETFQQIFKCPQIYASNSYVDAESITSSNLSCVNNAVAWLLQRDALRANDVVAVLDYAKQSDDEQTALALTDPRTLLRSLDHLPERSDEQITAVLKRFIDAGANAADLVSAATSRCISTPEHVDSLNPTMWFRLPQGPDDLAVLRLLISMGAPTIPELTKRNDAFADPALWGEEVRVDSKFIVEKMVSFGVDTRFAMQEVHKLTKPEVNLLAKHELEQILHQRVYASKAEKISALHGVLLAGGWIHAVALARNMVQTDASLDDLEALIFAGLSSTDLLADLTVSVYSPRRKYMPRERPAQLILQLIRSGADAFSATTKLVKAIEREFEGIEYEWQRMETEENAQQLITAARLMMSDALRNLLQAKDLPNADKVAELKKWIGNKRVKSIMDEMLVYAVKDGHLATMKLMVLAGVPATGAFISLARELGNWEESTHARTRELIRLGADFRPAMAKIVERIEVYKKTHQHADAAREEKALHLLGVAIASELAPPKPGLTH
ncbi:ankyrin repeat domain-containing protein [Bordetella tumulicola]|uniref:ankyrin repeat domain-containing protein n=1 Tax=Bordetella tumulicola TaxID=1649133 RepID=UPI0039EE73EA